MIRIMYAMAAAVVIGLAGCGKQEPSPPTPELGSPAAQAGPTAAPPAPQAPEAPKVTLDDVKKEAGEALGVSRQYLAQEKEDLVASMQKKLDDMEAQLQELRAKATDAGDATQEKLGVTLADLERKMDTARTELGRVKDATAETFADARQRTTIAFERLRHGVAQAWTALQAPQTEPAPPASEPEMFK